MIAANAANGANAATAANAEFVLAFVCRYITVAGNADPPVEVSGYRAK